MDKTDALVGSMDLTIDQNRLQHGAEINDPMGPSEEHVDASEVTIRQVADIPEEEALCFLEELQKPPKFICEWKGTQMDVPLVLSMLDTQQWVSIKALLDTGCTGSSIDAQFVCNNSIATTKLPSPIPVYNADGSHNSSGAIINFVELKIEIGDHVEWLPFAVTNLEKTPMFLEYKWLQIHNPSIDWIEQTIQFDQCPLTCQYTAKLLDIKEDVPELDDLEARLEEEDRIFCLNYHSYLKLNKVQIRTIATNLAIKEN